MLKGTVKMFIAKKGYGFIKPEAGGDDIFVHISELQKSGLRDLADGQNVTFDIGSDKGKKFAVNVKLA